MEVLSQFEPRTLLLAGALLVGLAFGAVARLSAFCLRSAVLEVRDGQPGPRALSYAAALAAAVAGAQALHLAGAVDLRQSLYLASAASLPAVALGGLLFGVGMILARGCGARHLVLAAGGNLRSWAVLILLGLVAYATLRGILAPLRVWLEALVPAGAAAGVPEALPIEAATAAWLAAGLAVLAAGALAVRVARGGLRGGALAGHLAAGVAVGLLVPAGWLVTGVLGADDFDPVPLAALTYTAPVGDGLQYLLTYTGASLDFGIVTVAGTLLGALAVALLRRDLRLEAFRDARHLLRSAAGAALMGFGGVLALGCTIGAGLTGVSTLSLASLTALAGILLGARLTLALRARRAAPAALEAPAE
jgi:hypothetical protein